ncbi:MAG TPA: SLATT domain-containing protein [Micromonosporaceae bacterium]|nr:SLATT domain-containing protein [Micromonosporaceae bacterium]
MAIPVGRTSKNRLVGRGELQPPGSPVTSVDDWGEPAPALDRLRLWAEQYAGGAIAWHLRGQRGKRLASRILRGAAVVLIVAAVVAAVVWSGRGPVHPNLGYVLLALAAGCLAFDHFFGLASGWQRDLATARALQARLLEFQLAWVAWQATQAGHGPQLPPSAEWRGGGDRTAQPSVADSVHAGRGLIEGLVLAVSRLAGRDTGGAGRHQLQPNRVTPGEGAAAVGR